MEEYTSIIGETIQAVKIPHGNKITDKAKKMCQVWGMRKSSYLLTEMSLMYSILADINSYLSMDTEQRRLYALIEPSIKYMEENYNDCNIKNDDLAKMSNISTVYFRKIFTKLFGVAPMHYIVIRKIEKAKELLSYDEFSITEIAASSGFKDIYHFCRAFKNITGFSPTNYRNKFLK